MSKKPSEWEYLIWKLLRKLHFHLGESALWMLHLCIPVYLQRVQPEYIKYAMQSLYDVANKINAFVSFVDKVSHSELRRIGDCLFDLFKSVVQSDMKSMRKVFGEHITWLKRNSLVSAEKSQYFWDVLFATLPAFVSFTNATKATSLATKRGLSVYSDIRLPNNWHRNGNVSYPIHNQTNNDQFKWIECQNIYIDVNEFLVQTISGNNSQQKERVSNQTWQYSVHVVDKLYQKHLFYDCVEEIGVVMDVFEMELERIYIDVENILQIIPGMGETGYWKIIKGNLGRLNFTSVWLFELVASYAANKTTKIELSNIIGQDMLSDIESLLDHVISVITLKGIGPFLEKINQLDINADSWYKKALDIVQMSVPSYEARGIKSLHIWRHPVALLETEDILKFKYSVSDTWRSWEMSATLNDFIISGNAKRLVWNITKEFANTLHLELMRIKMQLRNERHRVLESFADVISHFTDIHQEKLIGEEFIL